LNRFIGEITYSPPTHRKIDQTLERNCVYTAQPAPPAPAVRPAGSFDSELQVVVDLDGHEIGRVNLPDAANVADGLKQTPVRTAPIRFSVNGLDDTTTFEPGKSTPHTLTADIRDGCGGPNQHYTVSVAVDVVAFR
jgi:hypothetical protein